jgi:hypothetical protein
VQELVPECDADLPNVRRSATWDGAAAPYLAVLDDSAVVIGDIVRDGRQRSVTRAFVRAGPRARTYFDPSTVRAAIVTCGGLCPGLNNVIRELVDTLTFAYGVHSIVGVPNGYWGFHTPDAGAGRGGSVPRALRVCIGAVCSRAASKT